MKNKPTKIKSWQEEFDRIVKAPEILKDMKDQSCFVCGARYDKHPEVQELKSFIASKLEELLEEVEEGINNKFIEWVVRIAYPDPITQQEELETKIKDLKIKWGLK